MVSSRRNLIVHGLIPLVVAQVVVLAGCGSSDPQTVDQGPPKTQAEGLNRLKAANAKHDETAPVNQRSYASRTGR